MKTIEEKAEEYISGYGDGYAPEGINVSQDPWEEERGFTLEEGKQIFIDGAKFALENQWHDLVKNPDDMPDSKLYDWVLVSFKDSRDEFIGVPTIAEFRNGVWNTTESYEGTWGSVKDVLGDAIAWMPIPSLPEKLK